MELTRRPKVAMRGALIAAAVTGVIAGVSAPGEDLVLRGCVGVIVGVLMLAVAPRRPESSTAWRVVGAGDILLGVGWFARAAAVSADAFFVADLVVAAGFTVWAVGFMVGVPRPRSWAENLDGSLLALAVTLTVGLVAIPRIRPDAGWHEAVVGVGMMLAALLGPGVVASVMASGRIRPGPYFPAAVTASAMLTLAGLLTAAARTAGLPLTPLGRVLWVAGPLVAASCVLAPGAIHLTPQGLPTPRLTMRRVISLTGVAMVPVLVSVLDPVAATTPAITAAMLCLLLLVVRIGLSLRHDIMDVQHAADVRFSKLVEHAAEVLALVRPDGQLIYVSEPATTHFGLRPDELVGGPISQLLVADDAGAWQHALDRAARAPGIPVRARVRMVDGAGVERHVECTVVDLCHLADVGAISLTINDITDRVQLETELVRQARIDDLTGLFNRHVLADRVEHVLTQRNNSCALVYLDINEFKLINDGYGHAAGDAVLAAVGERVQTAMRTSDSAARLGGDEFAVLLEDLGASPLGGVLQVAARIHEACAEPVLIAPDEFVRVRVAVGVAMAEPGWTGTEMFAAADAAMYTAKREHRGTVVFEQRMLVPSKSRLQLRHDLEAAIEQRAFEMHYQPIVELDDLRMTGVEALLRWTHPTLGKVAPDRIIDQADAAGLTSALTDAILERVGADLRMWRDAVERPLGMALNLSAQQLMHVRPADVLLQLGGRTAHPSSLTIEVTETSLLGDVTAAARVLSAFRRAGCHVAVDDFGTGYASIGYLRRLPVDRLKIDREFIDDLAPEGAGESFAAVIQWLASALGLLTVAEGVETEEHLAAVRAIGCRFGQGYLFGKPMEMQRLIASELERTADLAVVTPVAQP